MSWLAPSEAMVWCGNRHRPGRAGTRLHDGIPDGSEANVDSDWLPDDEIRRLISTAAAGEPAGLHSYIAASPLRATDSAYSCMVLVRDHDAWFIRGWHDANAPVAEGGVGLQMVNYFDEGFWSKLPVPIGDRVKSVDWDGSHFVLETGRCLVRSTPAQLRAAVMDSMTGRGLTEEMIAHNFAKLDGSVPLDWP
jgi:hypothetical protein